MAYDFSKHSKEELLAEYARVKGASQPTAQVQPRQTQGIVMDALNKFSPSLAANIGGLARGAAQNFGSGGVGENDLQKLFAQESIKKQFEDKEMTSLKKDALRAGMTTDADGNIIKTSDIARDEREKRLHDFESRRQAGILRGELNQNTYVKRFQEMNSAATGIDAILADTLARPDLKSKNVGDQALITLYNKILDPLSVVRESEYARTPEGQALLNRIQGFVEKVKAGGSGLTDQDRIEIARAAKVLINNSGELYNSKIGEYENLAGAYGIQDKNLVTGGMSRFTPYDIDKGYGAPTQQVQPTGQQQPSGNLSVGQMFNGKPIKAVRRVR